MSHRTIVTAALGATLVAGSFACEDLQDLGRHAPIADAGVPDIFIPFPSFDGAVGPAKIVFVTEGRFTGDLATEGAAASGPAGADNLCMREARAAGLGATFKAWLSTTTESARNRIAAVGPWSLVDGASCFDEVAVNGPPFCFPSVTAKGADLKFGADLEVWTGTGTLHQLSPSGNTCRDWKSALAADQGSYGDLAFSSQWTEAQDFDGQALSKPCSARLRLYCFEQ